MSFSRCRYACFTSFSDSAPAYGTGLSYLIYQREEGEGGRAHWQGYAECSATAGWRLPQWKAAVGDSAAHFERRKGTAKQAADYCRKPEGRLAEPVEHGALRETSASGGRAAEERAAFGRALAADNIDGAIQILIEAVPDAYCRSYASIQKALAAHFAPPQQLYSTPAAYRMAWQVPDVLQQWVRDELPRSERAKMLVLIGATRLGKTAWARSLADHIFWRGAINIKDWRDEAKLLIIDDCDWRKLPFKKQLCTQMGTVTLTQKYQPMRTVNANKPVIWCCNDEPDWATEADYWKANSTIVYLTAPLFSSTQTRLYLHVASVLLNSGTSVVVGDFE